MVSVIKDPVSRKECGVLCFNHPSRFVRGRGQRIHGEIMWHCRESRQAVNGENKRQPVILEKTSLLDSDDLGSLC